MKKGFWTVLTSVILLVALSFAALVWVRFARQSWSRLQARGTTKTLNIKWQRLVGDKGQTCERCGTTRVEVRQAYALLRKSLSPLGIDVVLEEKTLDKATAAKDITESNRIWVAGKPLEGWLGAKSGTSDCASCGSLCEAATTGGVACRTVVVDGRTYEAIPSELIVKAGLLAAADMAGVRTERPCCPGANPGGGAK